MNESIDTESDRCKYCHGIEKKNLEDHEQTCEKLTDFVAAKDECFQCMLCSETFLNRANTCEHILSNTEHMYSIIENNSDDFLLRLAFFQNASQERTSYSQDGGMAGNDPSV